MITLSHDCLFIEFPDIHENSSFLISFQRTLRIPDDGRKHFLPPGLGSFPLRHIEDYDLGDQEHLKKRGGVIMPMFQSDALWLKFGSYGLDVKYPIALKIGAGKINAVSGLKWSDGISNEPQDYVVFPDQPWLDGFNVEKGIIKQFVAMPLGNGFTVEEQITSKCDVGGIQIEAIPMKKEAYKELKKENDYKVRHTGISGLSSHHDPGACWSISPMGLGMGGTMKQKIAKDKYGLDVWDMNKRQRCFITLANAEQWMSITGEEPPLSPLSASQYSKAGLPWFDFYGEDIKAIDGAKSLGKIKSIKELGMELKNNVWPNDDLITEFKVINLDN